MAEEKINPKIEKNKSLENVSKTDKIEKSPEMSAEEIKKENSLVEGIPVNIKKDIKEPVLEDKYSWKSRTSIGKKIMSGEITSLDQILDQGQKILEPEIVEALLPDLQTELLLIGQAKGKFGGGQRRVFKQTQKKTKKGNKPKFTTFAVAGNENGFVGVGRGKSKETVPAREKSFRRAKLNIMKIKRGCGSWACNCGEPHSIPFEIQGKCGSSIIKIMPAPKGTGLKVEKECAKILKLAGIKDVWSKTRGQTKTKINLIQACANALKQLSNTKTQLKHNSQLGIISGVLSNQNKIDQEFLEEIKAPEVKQ